MTAQNIEFTTGLTLPESYTFSMRIAITRKVSSSLGRCELTHLARVPIDILVAEQQHRAYEQCLAALGCEIHSLPAEPDLPDSVFVEDAAVVLDEVAIIARPGAESRRREIASIAEALRPYRELRSISAPATLDGGDVLRVGRKIYVGLSSRTSNLGLEQIREFLGPHGYCVEGVAVKGCLHLKSAVTQVSARSLLINPHWVSPAAFATMHLIEVAPTEPFAANALCVGETVLYPAAFAATLARLERNGLRVAGVDVSELSKAEGAVTCCSVVFETSKG